MPVLLVKDALVAILMLPETSVAATAFGPDAQLVQWLGRTRRVLNAQGLLEEMGRKLRELGWQIHRWWRDGRRLASPGPPQISPRLGGCRLRRFGG